MLMACKYEEVMLPQVIEFTAITAGAYSRQDVLKMEKLMLNTLQFNLSVPAPLLFMRRFLKDAESDDKEGATWHGHLEEKKALLHARKALLQATCLAGYVLRTCEAQLKGRKPPSREFERAYRSRQNISVSLVFLPPAI